MDAELKIVETSVESALQDGTWWYFFPTPRGAWDRDGALIAETVAQDVAQDLIDVFSHLTAWQSVLASRRGRGSDEPMVEFGSGSDVGAVLVDLVPRITQARRHLAGLAYPDARDLEPDPDIEPPQRLKRRWWRPRNSPG